MEHRRCYDQGNRRRWGSTPYNREAFNRGRGSQRTNNYRGQTHERSFDNQGREEHQFRHSNFNKRPYNNRGHCNHSQTNREREAVTPQLSPLEAKAQSFLHRVLAQSGIRSKLIFLESVENSIQTLKTAVDVYQMRLVVEENSAAHEYILKIDEEELASGTFDSKQVARQSLSDRALDVLKKDCFYIIKKPEYEAVSVHSCQQAPEQPEPQTSLEGSKAHKMMLKMGWSGKGLGVNEQGSEKTVAETINENITRSGLGNDNVFKKIHDVLEEYVKSDRMTLLKFDPDFTSDERAHIHKIALKFGLKSKSEGKGDQRRMTITKKLSREDLVFNLLTSGLENSLYKLIIPQNFRHLWQDDEAEVERGD